ncbi:PEP-CTERM sorting domain-containing protein [Tundrisphaera sp. TA3]|uniref:PEP-CTERM sorting domain-containing protein n=1 Tax=Tundrisphaera sp. TA3 TaxID=3435775 RepID=UPI003EB98C6A
MISARILLTGLITLCLFADRPAGAAFVAINPSGSVGQTVTTEFTPGPIATTTYFESQNASGPFTTGSQFFYGRFNQVTTAQSTRFLVKFNLGSLAGADITAATLDFSVANGFYSGGVEVFGYGSGTVDARASDYVGGGLVSNATLREVIDNPSTGQPLSLDAGFIRTLAKAGVPAVAFMFTVDSFGAYNGMTGGVSFTAPRLNVTFQPASVPEPSSLVLCSLAGLAGLGGAALRRRAVATA